MSARTSTPAPCTVTAPATLLDYMFTSWPQLKKKQIRTWLKHHAVTVNGRAITRFDHALLPGDVVAIRTDRFARPANILASGMKIFHEDAQIIVIEKPSGLLSMASQVESEKTAYFQLNDYVRRGDLRSQERVWIVHRLDRETSGVMVFARTARAKETLQSGWDRAEKRYEAVVEGAPPSGSGTFESDLDESHPAIVRITRAGPETRHAVTHYRVVTRGRRRALVELTLETGRRHQIRVQLADAGCPIVGDRKYGARSDPAKRLALHACRLGFDHPTTGEPLRFESPLPKELARLL